LKRTGRGEGKSLIKGDPSLGRGGEEGHLSNQTWNRKKKNKNERKKVT